MIFYFTATGNSKFIAERLAKSTGDGIMDIADCVKNERYNFELNEGESFGVVTPVYFLGIPMIVSDFLQNLKLKSTQSFYSYAVLNCGGTTGNAEKLLKRFIDFNAIFGVLAPDNYVPMFKTGSVEDKNNQLDKAETAIGLIAEHINKKDTINLNPLRGRLPRLLTAVVYPMYKRGRKTKKFTVNNGCTGCGLCKSICPCKAIDIKNGKPQWVVPKCEICLACLHRCPTAAINYGKKSAKNGRYINLRTQL